MRARVFGWRGAKAKLQQFLSWHCHLSDWNWGNWPDTGFFHRPLAPWKTVFIFASILGRLLLPWHAYHSNWIKLPCNLNLKVICHCPQKALCARLRLVTIWVETGWGEVENAGLPTLGVSFFQPAMKVAPFTLARVYINGNLTLRPIMIAKLKWVCVECKAARDYWFLVVSALEGFGKCSQSIKAFEGNQVEYIIALGWSLKWPSFAIRQIYIIRKQL